VDVWDVMASTLWLVLLTAWFVLVIRILGDVFSDDDLSGPAKAAWCVLVVMFPWIGIFTYLFVRGQGMARRDPVGVSGDDVVPHVRYP
jgi:hypothetical protein